MINSIPMTYFAPTVCSCLGVESPKASHEPEALVSGLLDSCGLSRVDRVLVYNPDAIGMWLYQRHTDMFAPVLRHTRLALPVRTVLPSVTPVCFGTMYTGVLPGVHGIERYEKHVLDQESVFDRLAAAHRSCALVAVKDSSMDILYAEKPVDHFVEPYDGEATERAVELIRAREHDVVVVYNQEYDDRMHHTYPESAESLQALGRQVANFDRLCQAVRESWADGSTLVVWATDHGIHIADMGYGAHGSDREDDLNVLHFFGIYPGDAEADRG